MQCFWFPEDILITVILIENNRDCVKSDWNDRVKEIVLKVTEMIESKTVLIYWFITQIQFIFIFLSNLQGF